MPLTLKEVKHIARLARLELTGDQESLYREQLSAILDYMTQLRELDTADVTPTAGGGQTQMTLRADEVHHSLSPEELLRNAPESDEDQFKIPPVFE
jgi:aspartyl-tRNA(Asn)/glutamyl-tRNA(Gln) amidotransferase subunit C